MNEKKFYAAKEDPGRLKACGPIGVVLRFFFRSLHRHNVANYPITNRYTILYSTVKLFNQSFQQEEEGTSSEEPSEI